jgi:hypothetical protein
VAEAEFVKKMILSMNLRRSLACASQLHLTGALLRSYPMHLVFM